MALAQAIRAVCVSVCVCVCVCVCWEWASGNTWLQLARLGVAGKHENPDMAAGHRGTRKLPLQRPQGWGRGSGSWGTGLPAAAAPSPCRLLSLCKAVLKEQERLDLHSLTSRFTSAAFL